MSSLTLKQKLDETADAIRKRTTAKPAVGVVLGSGLGAFGDSLGGVTKIPYGELPHMSASAVVGHAGNFCIGDMRGVSTICMQGRVHLYEGHAVEAVVQGVRVMARMGVKAVLLTNAAGGLNPGWLPGDLMIVRDQLNLTGKSPLIGPNDDSLGPRFPDMSAAYDADLIACVRAVALKEKIALREGVYAGLLGPTYETPAEVRMLRSFGADAVGMSTVLEVIALRHMGVRVGALSCVTNLASGISKHKLTHEEVEATAASRRGEMLAILGGWVERAGAI